MLLRNRNALFIQKPQYLERRRGVSKKTEKKTKEKKTQKEKGASEYQVEKTENTKRENIREDPLASQCFV